MFSLLLDVKRVVEGKVKFDYNFHGVQVCEGTFLKIYDYAEKNRRAQEYRAAIQKGVFELPGSSALYEVSAGKNARTMLCLKWMNSYIKDHSEFRPAATSDGQSEEYYTAGTHAARYDLYMAGLKDKGIENQQLKTPIHLHKHINT